MSALKDAHEKQCAGKVAYYAKDVAKKVRRKMEHLYHVKFSWYRCKHCGYFHVGKRSKKV